MCVACTILEEVGVSDRDRLTYREGEDRRGIWVWNLKESQRCPDSSTCGERGIVIPQSVGCDWTPSSIGTRERSPVDNQLRVRRGCSSRWALRRLNWYGCHLSDYRYVSSGLCTPPNDILRLDSCMNGSSLYKAVSVSENAHIDLTEGIADYGGYCLLCCCWSRCCWVTARASRALSEGWRPIRRIDSAKEDSICRDDDSVATQGCWCAPCYFNSGLSDDRGRNNVSYWELGPSGSHNLKNFPILFSGLRPPMHIASAIAKAVGGTTLDLSSSSLHSACIIIFKLCNSGRIDQCVNNLHEALTIRSVDFEAICQDRCTTICGIWWEEDHKRSFARRCSTLWR